MIKWLIQEEDITIVNIYAPNIGAPQYIRWTLTDIKGELDSNAIIVGEFNTPLTPMDRSSKQKVNKEAHVWNDTLDEMDLIDIFRTFHPNAEEYTFFLFWVLVLEGLRSLHRTVQLQLLQPHYWSGHRLGLSWYWMVCLGNKQIILSFLILHPSTGFQTLVDYDGYSISSKGFLLTVISNMVVLKVLLLNLYFKSIKCNKRRVPLIII